MIIAGLLDIGINLLFAVQVVVCLLLLGIILMQRPKQEGLGAAFGAALTDQAFGARTTDVLQKGTVYLGSMFMIFSFVLALLIVHRSELEKSTLSPVKETIVEEEVIIDPSKQDAAALKDLQKQLEGIEGNKAPEQAPAEGAPAESAPAPAPAPVPTPAPEQKPA